MFNYSKMALQTKLEKLELIFIYMKPLLQFVYMIFLKKHKFWSLKKSTGFLSEEMEMF